MFGLIGKKDVLDKLNYIENNIKEWESIWSDSKDENVRITVINTLQTINKLVKNIFQRRVLICINHFIQK